MSKDCWYTLVPIYNNHLYFVRTLKAYSKLLSDLGYEYIEVEGCNGGTIWFPSAQTSIVCVFNDSLQTLAHEAVHSAWDMLSNAGVVATDDNQEALAYLTDYIFGQALPYMKGAADTPKPVRTRHVKNYGK